MKKSKIFDLSTMTHLKRKRELSRVSNSVELKPLFRIFVIGGGVYNEDEIETVYSTVEEFDVTTNQWSTRSSMNEARTDFAIATHQGKIYVFGGWRDMQNIISCEKYVARHPQQLLKNYSHSNYFMDHDVENTQFTDTICNISSHFTLLTATITGFLKW